MNNEMKIKLILSSAALLLAGVFFVINDAIINFLSIQNVKFYHFIFYGTPAYLSVPVYLIIKGNFKKKMYATNYYIPLFRGLIFAPIPLFTFISLKNISLPEFTTLNMSSPLFAGLFSLFLLKEKLNIYIVISLSFGILGVFFVVQPGFESFNIFFLLTLFGSFLITFTTFITNKYNKVTSTIGYFIYGGLFIHPLSFFLFVFDPISVSLDVFLMITLASVLINIAIFLSVYAFIKSQKYYASIFCLVYLQILWSSIIGFIFFNEFLNNIALLGAAFIVLSGLISIPGQMKQVNEK